MLALHVPLLLFETSRVSDSKGGVYADRSRVGCCRALVAIFSLERRAGEVWGDRAFV